LVEASNAIHGVLVRWRRLKPTLLKGENAHDENGVVVATKFKSAGRRPAVQEAGES
jgi:hypothetical protein